MADYTVEIDVNNLNTSHAQLISLVGRDRTVLDVGCWTGGLGRVLQSRGCRVSGVEVDPAAAAVAREAFDRVVEMDLNQVSLLEHFEPDQFDAIVLGDVLEHLVDPVGVLAAASRLLAPGGRVVMSVPNVTHGALRLALLQGRWRYTPTGLLDRSHIRFFSREGLLQVVRDAGLVLDELRATLADPLSVEVEVDDLSLPPAVVEWVREQPDALVYQFVLSVRRDDSDATLDRPPAVLELPVSPRSVRRHDGHTEAAHAAIAERRELLTVRDHIIGLEASVSAAEDRAAQAAARAQRLRQRLTQVKERSEQLHGRVKTLESRVAAAEGLALRTHVARSVAHLLRPRRTTP